MLRLSPRQQLAIGIGLTALMIATRGQHFPTIKQALPSASWAVFFLAGVYLRPAWTLAPLLGLAALVDHAAITWSGVSAFCVSPVYVALLPAYGVLWAAGRWYAGRANPRPATLLPLTASVVIGTAAYELISSGSFYFYSGQFTHPTFAEFGARFLRYSPHDLRSVAFWVGAAALAHLATIAWRRNDAQFR